MKDQESLDQLLAHIRAEIYEQQTPWTEHGTNVPPPPFVTISRDFRAPS